MSSMMCWRALDPRPKTWLSGSVPEFVDDTQLLEKNWERGPLHLSVPPTCERRKLLSRGWAR